MMYAIKRAGVLKAVVQAEGKATSKIMDTEIVSMSFYLANFIDFMIGDNVSVYGKLYRLNRKPITQKVATNKWRYQLEFESIKYELGKIQFMFPDENNNLTIGDFSINGNAGTILNLIVENANRTQEGWSVGNVNLTLVKNFTFTAQNLLSALAMIAEGFENEFWIDENKAIHFEKRNLTSGLSLQYGKSLGLHSITRNTLDDSRVITRLYAFGSEKNISNGYRNGSPRLRLENHYIEQNTELYDIIEHTEIFEDVYPHRKGTVTHVDSTNPLKFRDSGINFNLNSTLPNSNFVKYVSSGAIKYKLIDLQLVTSIDLTSAPILNWINNQNSLKPVSMLIPGVAAKVSFTSGQLTGYTFEIAAGGWNNTTKEITLIRNTDEKAFELPNDLLKPAVGDSYVITDIIMPESYIVAAEQMLLQRAYEYLNKHSKPQLKYNIITDHLYLREHNIQLRIGDSVHFIDPHFNLDSNLRITSLTQDLQNPFDVEFEISEFVAANILVQNALSKFKINTEAKKFNRFNIQVNRLNNIQTADTVKKFEIIGNLDLIKDKTLVSNVIELDTLKIPLDAPFKKITEFKITNWNLVETQFNIDSKANPLAIYQSIKKRK